MIRPVPVIFWATGRIALAAAMAEPENWSPEAVSYIYMSTKQADGFLPEHLTIIAENLAQILLDALVEVARRHEDSN